VYPHSLATPFTKIEYLIKIFKDGTKLVDFNTAMILLDMDLQVLGEYD
jgi:hypothetical protein